MKTNWLWAATLLTVAIIPCGIASFRGPAQDRLIGVQMAGLITSLSMVLFAQGFGRSYLYDLALALAVLSFGGGLVFARFLERWL